MLLLKAGLSPQREKHSHLVVLVVGLERPSEEPSQLVGLECALAVVLAPEARA